MPDKQDGGSRFRVGQHLWHWDADTENLSRSGDSDDDGPFSLLDGPGVPLRIRLAGIGTGAVVGLVLAANLFLIGYSGWVVSAISVAIGVISLWDETTRSAIVETGVALGLTLVAMLPVTYYLPRYVPDELIGGGTELVSLLVWIAIAAIVRWVIGGLITAQMGEPA